MTRCLPALTVFLGSFLLFGVQPMLGRTLLPSFGGTAAVWTVCLAAYQTLLLVGYYYAHIVARCRMSTQRTLHLSLLGVAICWTGAFTVLRPLIKAYVGNSAQPALEVLFCVLLFAGLPYVLLSAGSSIVQAWLSRSADATSPNSGENVYRLYAVSNLGSFLGLLVYPFILEPYLALTTQWICLVLGLAAYATLIYRLSTRLSFGVLPDKGLKALPLPQGVLPDKSRSTEWLWFLLPCLSVFLLNAVTTHLTLDVMPLPLLWVALLGFFLLSYVIGFSTRLSKWSHVYEVFTIACVFLAVATLRGKGASAGFFAANLTVGLGLCLTGCAFLHSWLFKLRPSTDQLTRYYLASAAGGALGGLLASLGAPMIFKSVAEYPLALLAIVCMAGYLRFKFGEQAPVRWLYVPLAILCIAGVGYKTYLAEERGATVVVRDRGFFGTVKVIQRNAMVGQAQGVVHDFLHGTTVHGIQLRVPGKERMTTAYYTVDSGGVGILQHPKYKRGEPMRVGLLGMGVGVVAGYCRSNDVYRCYEISEEVIRLATDARIYSFLADAPGKIEVVKGDGRKELERDRSLGLPKFDVLVVDAFTGDSQPYHVSTKEAFELYFSRLEPDGILAVNISNWNLDLTPLIKAVAEAFACPVVAIRQEDKLGQLRLSSMWAFFIPRPPKDFQLPPDASRLDFRQVDKFTLPTDEKGSFLKLINWPWKQ